MTLEKLLLASETLQLNAAFLILLSFLCWTRLFKFFHGSS